MFIGRKKEISLLNEKILSNKFEFGIIYGRRRIGKTLLIKEVLKKNKGIYFVANEMDYQYNVQELSKIVSNFYDVKFIFNDLKSIFEFLKEKSKSERVIIVIDEFTYLFAKESGIQSILQNIIDDLLQSNVLLLLSGSQVGMIEDVISYKKPLYGRLTFKIKLEAFNYYESSMFYTKFSNLDKIRSYAIFGGIPHYLSMINDNKSLDENIIELIVNPNGILYNETEFFLKQELRSVNTYSLIINAVSAGATRLNEITTKANVSSTAVASNCIKLLIELDILKKELCFGENENSKKTLYKIKDNFFNFYYRFIVKNRSAASVLEPKVFFEAFVKEKLDEYVSYIFEDVCKEFLIIKNKSNTINPFFEIGRFWGVNNNLKREVEIDLVTKDAKGIIVYECKWTNDLFRKKEYDDLVLETDFLNPYMYGGFSKSGFSDELSGEKVLKINIDDLYN